MFGGAADSGGDGDGHYEVAGVLSACGCSDDSLNGAAPDSRWKAVENQTLPEVLWGVSSAGQMLY